MSKIKVMNDPARTKALIDKMTKAGVKYVQIEVPDMDGMLRGKITKPSKGFGDLGNAYCTILYGLSTQDDVMESEFSSFENGFPDLFTVPYLDSAIHQSWRPEFASVVCDMVDPASGELCPMSPRTVLRKAIEKAEAAGFDVRCAVEYETYIMRADNDLIKQGRHYDLPMLSRTMNAYSLTRIVDIEDIMREYHSRMASVGIEIDAFHCELGYGQVEFALSHAPALEMADRAARAKLYFKQLCIEHGLVATFMSKWRIGDTGTGAHIHLSLWKDGKPAFSTGKAGELSTVGRQFAAGMMDVMPELTAIYNPVINSYRRRSSLQWCPENASWAEDNRTAALRAITGPKPEGVRIETRQPGGDMNPYLCIAASILSGLRGIENGLEPLSYATGNAGNDPRFRRLPRNLRDATRMFKESETVRDLLGSDFVGQYALTRDTECDLYEQWVAENVTEWELRRYFDTI
ncbi:glutamine synthetase family protein [Rhodobacteraceae bacterium HSP-20]|uniref:Glutamine synthetase family protein n=1 Tax=Paragemmobacter amnigenus TaxID=2852097 RepID=A0ABS6J9C4_9RHOB|nr:glutamine synthetase family protein [Rhodobacter amnigenus]MBU9700102.1 glutamine synthetase family protein [Rhodobacter amnigenus]MBV4391329.1 glutamine synthetase family protein [Rhodobacter amnigenus]